MTTGGRFFVRVSEVCVNYHGASSGTRKDPNGGTLCDRGARGCCWRFMEWLRCTYVAATMWCWENPLPTVQDNRIVGSWATPDGKLYAVIKPGDNSAYQSLSADDITKGASGTTFYLAKVGGTLLTETPSACNAFLFSAPSATDAPSGCWTITRLVLSGQFLWSMTPSTPTLMLRQKRGLAEGSEISACCLAHPSQRAPIRQLIPTC